MTRPPGFTKPCGLKRKSANPHRHHFFPAFPPRSVFFPLSFLKVQLKQLSVNVNTVNCVLKVWGICKNVGQSLLLRICITSNLPHTNLITDSNHPTQRLRPCEKHSLHSHIHYSERTDNVNQRSSFKLRSNSCTNQRCLFPEGTLKYAALQFVFPIGASKAAFLCAQEGLLSQGFPSSCSKGDSTGVKLGQGEAVPQAQLPNGQLL